MSFLNSAKFGPLHNVPAAMRGQFMQGNPRRFYNKYIGTWGDERVMVAETQQRYRSQYSDQLNERNKDEVKRLRVRIRVIDNQISRLDMFPGSNQSYQLAEKIVERDELKKSLDAFEKSIIKDERTLFIDTAQRVFAESSVSVERLFSSLQEDVFENEEQRQRYENEYKELINQEIEEARAGYIDAFGKQDDEDMYNILLQSRIDVSKSATSRAAEFSNLLDVRNELSSDARKFFDFEIDQRAAVKDAFRQIDAAFNQAEVAERDTLENRKKIVDAATSALRQFQRRYEDQLLTIQREFQSQTSMRRLADIQRAVYVVLTRNNLKAGFRQVPRAIDDKIKDLSRFISDGELFADDSELSSNFLKIVKDQRDRYTKLEGEYEKLARFESFQTMDQVKARFVQIQGEEDMLRKDVAESKELYNRIPSDYRDITTAEILNTVEEIEQSLDSARIELLKRQISTKIANIR